MTEDPPGIREILPRISASIDGRCPQGIADLLSLRGAALWRLMEVAGTLRDKGLAEAGRPQCLTYSRKVFIPLTRLCRNRCAYCAFTRQYRAERSEGRAAPFLEPEEVIALAAAGAAVGCKEALFTLGDHPERRWVAARAWLDARGYASTLDYVAACADAVLRETGLLPHVNPGTMTLRDLLRLRTVAPGAGMMLETTATRLWAEPSGPHFRSPDKEPASRLSVLEDAGRAGVPFTTGILIGIGETMVERAESLLALQDIAERGGHIQEVIIQGFTPSPSTPMRAVPGARLDDLAATIAVARLMLGAHAHVQSPPNLVGPGLGMLIRAGIDDLGGISPVTPDHVNPGHPWPMIDDLAERIGECGFRLVERLTVYPEYVTSAGAWMDPRLVGRVRAMADDTTGLAASEVRLERPVIPPVQVPERLDAAVKLGLSLAASNPASLLDPVNEREAVALFHATGPALESLAGVADDLRRDAVGDDVTYVVNRNINFSNICYVGCGFCAYARRDGDTDASRLTVEQVADRAAEAAGLGATEVCLQGGIDPKLSPSVYVDMIHAIKERTNGIHIHGYSPMEIVTTARKAGAPVSEWLERLRLAGLGSMPGTAAEIFDEEVRRKLTPRKLSTAEWVSVVQVAHELGIRSTATMMYGHVDQPEHWLGHIRVIAQLQDRTGGFTEFVPLPFVHHRTPIYLAGVSRPGATSQENRVVHAMARVLLHGRIGNIQCSWVKMGDAGAAELLRGGCNDLGGTLIDESISQSAGSWHGSERTMHQLNAIAAAVGRPARQRTTLYGHTGV